MVMGFVFYKGTKEEVEEKMERLKVEAKEGYPNSYRIDFEKAIDYLDKWQVQGKLLSTT